MINLQGILVNARFFLHFFRSECHLTLTCVYINYADGLCVLFRAINVHFYLRAEKVTEIALMWLHECVEISPNKLELSLQRPKTTVVESQHPTSTHLHTTTVGMSLAGWLSGTCPLPGDMDVARVAYQGKLLWKLWNYLLSCCISI